jgi:hypothetical protein
LKKSPIGPAKIAYLDWLPQGGPLEVVVPAFVTTIGLPHRVSTFAAVESSLRTKIDLSTSRSTVKKTDLSHLSVHLKMTDRTAKAFITVVLLHSRRGIDVLLK